MDLIMKLVHLVSIFAAIVSAASAADHTRLAQVVASLIRYDEALAKYPLGNKAVDQLAELTGAPRFYPAEGRLDCVRMMRDTQFAYHKNYISYAPAGQFMDYMWKMSAAPAWEKHHRAGKTDEITGRFFRPRVSEEFYDTYADFDNVHKLIHAAQHQAKIAKLKQAMRQKQLELYDSGLLPEKMRERRAADYQMTIYEMVRDPKVYPFEKYLYAADLALERKSSNPGAFKKGLTDDDAGMRWWAVVGMLLLDKDAALAVEQLQNALNDTEDEIRMMAA
jgi:N-sulfoglucosamine sulfohydrolase